MTSSGLPDRAAQGGARLPLAILMDYDGTICRTDVLDRIATDRAVRPGWERLDAAYMDGRIGSRENLLGFLPFLPADPLPLHAIAEAQPHDPTFPTFVDRARELGATLEVVSDGFGFYVGHNLVRIGVPDLPISTAEMTWSAAGPALAFPAGNPTFLVCGTCKRERVLAHQARGRHVAFVGDGMSDRYAAAHADTVFAKDRLVELCEAEEIPYLRWETFDDISAWLAAVAAVPGSIAPPRARTFICGPEAWGPGPARLPADG